MSVPCSVVYVHVMGGLNAEVQFVQVGFIFLLLL